MPPASTSLSTFQRPYRFNRGSAIVAKDLQKRENRLCMTNFLVQAMQTTYDAHSQMTDSPSAGTAFACGINTKIDVVGMNETQTIRYKSIAQLAAETGKKVGIISSVSLNHATLASPTTPAFPVAAT